MLKNFVYNQDANVCSVDNKHFCNDKFSYITLGEWKGYGQYQMTKIELTPVVREFAVAGQTAPLGELAAQGPNDIKKADEPIEFKKDQEPIAIDNEPTDEACNDNTPILIGLCIFIFAMVVPIGVLFKKIKTLNTEASQAEMVNFESTQSKQALKMVIQEASEEVLKKDDPVPSVSLSVEEPPEVADEK